MAVKSMLEKVAGPAQRRFLAFFSSNIMQKTGQLFLLIGVTILGGADDVYRFGLFISLFALLIPLMSLNAHLSPSRLINDTGLTTSPTSASANDTRWLASLPVRPVW